MKAEFVGITNFIQCNQNPELAGRFLTPEQAICYMARVSNPSNQDSKLDDTEKLLEYLMVHSHWSPFDMIDMIVKIETSRAIMAQILRHWSFRFQEFSMRYSAVDKPDLSNVEMRRKHVDGNRQGSSTGVDALMQGLANDTLEDAADMYAHLIKHECAPECARMVLPLATPTTAYMKGSVRSWITYFWQRLDAHAQLEHRLLAEELFAIFSIQFPHLSALVKAGQPKYVRHGN